jgi:hypothetical protein
MFAAGTSLKAGPILTFGDAAVDLTDGADTTSFDAYTAQNVGAVTPNAASMAGANSATAPSWAISVNAAANTVVLPGTDNFTILTTGSATASSSIVSMGVNHLSGTAAYGSNGGSITLDGNYRYTITATLNTMLSATSTPGVYSYASGVGSGEFEFTSDNENVIVANGYIAVGEQSSGDGSHNLESGQSAVGYYIHEGNQTSGYNPTVEMSGVVGPGTYFYNSTVGAVTEAIGNYTASSSASASQTFSLTLTPTTQSPTPEPASLTLLGMGSLCLGLKQAKVSGYRRANRSRRSRR